jgi:RND superfamily putative drug exporter
VMLLLVYRSLTNVAVPMYSVLFEILIAKGIVSTLGHYGVIPMSSFAVNIVVSLTLGAGTDYGIFLMGRYHEARQLGESREEAYYTAYRGVSPIIIGSGLTIAGSCFCLTFARLDYFHTMGPAVAISMLFTIAAALTLAPALLTVGSLFGLFDPKRPTRGHLYRRIAASVVRWPVPILAASATVVLIGAIFVPSYSVSYDDRAYQPASGQANQGFAASDRHFPSSKLLTEMMMVESDHDMRNSADFISLDRVAKELVRLPGVAMVQSITRPLGRPLDHANVPYLFTVQGGAAGQQLPFNEHANDNTDEQARIQAETVATLGKTIDLTQRLADDLHTTVLTLENLQAVTDEVNADIANLDDTFRPLKAYFYFEPHCYDIPVCYAMRSLFDSLDGIDALDEQIGNAVTDFQAVDALMPQMVAQLKVTRDETQALQAVIVNSYGASHLQSTQTDQTFDDQINVGNDFDKSRSDDYFYMPREGFDNEDVKTGEQLLMSPDGKAARFVITHEGNALGPEGIDHVDQFPDAVKAALKETSLAGARIYVGGAASNDKDIKEYAAGDLKIVAIAAFVLIGLHLHWLVLPISFVILVAVGSDYNLLLIARVKEEIGGARQTAALHTSLIRALGSTGGVVTSAGLVFAFTMLALLASDLKTIAQVGSTVCIGLLLDTLIVRSFIVPSLIRLLGPWFWWPTLVRSRPMREPTDFPGVTR